MPTSQQRREELSELYSEATQGRWEQACGRSSEAVVAEDRKYDSVEQVRYGGSPIADCDTDPHCGSSESENEANARLIAAMHEALPALLADLTAVEQRYRELFCAVWECPPDEFDDTKHDGAVEEAHRQCRENFRLRPVERENAELREACEFALGYFESNYHLEHPNVTTMRKALTPPNQHPKPRK